MFGISVSVTWAAALMLSQGLDSSPKPLSTFPVSAGVRYVEKTVLVPQWTTERQSCTETRYRTEIQEKECVTYKSVPVTKEVPYKYTVYVREKKVVPQTLEIDTPVCKWVDQTYHEFYPSKMTVTRYRTRTECQPVTVKKVVTRDEGAWEVRQVESCDAKGNPCLKTQRVWVPNLVKKEIEVTENKTVCIREPYECEVDICVPVERTRRVKVWETKTETKTVENCYETVVPKTRTKMVTVCVTEKVREVTKVPVEVKVPYTVEVEKDVRVCKWVPRTICIPVPCRP
jgi:ribosomal protein L28